MSTIANLYSDVKTLCQQWFYTKNEVDTALDSLVDIIYPVGSIYMSVNSVNPSTLFGGTWEQIEDTFLLASGTNYANGSTGGEATHLLTASESGQKNLGTITSTGGNHSHNWSDYYYLRTQNKTETVVRNSNAGATGTKVQNLLQSTSGVARDVTPNSGNLSVSTTINGSDATSSHNNMPPYLAVNVWKRTA